MADTADTIDRTVSDGSGVGGRRSLLDGRRLLLIAALVGVIAAFFGFGLHKYFTPTFLDQNLSQIRDWVEAHRLVAVLVFVLVYAFAVVAFPPSGTAMTLLGGFVFGGLAGGTYVVVGATLGATLLFVIAKTTFGDPLKARAGPWLKKLEAGFQGNAFSYLLVLRLIPLFPFWLVNIAPAFLGVRLRSYVAATFIGIMPGTFVYASVGSSLSRLVDAPSPLKELVSTQFLLPAIGLFVLAMLPIVYKRFFARAA